jgi:hypothetical protein
MLLGVPPHIYHTGKCLKQMRRGKIKHTFQVQHTSVSLSFSLPDINKTREYEDISVLANSTIDYGA